MAEVGTEGQSLAEQMTLQSGPQVLQEDELHTTWVINNNKGETRKSGLGHLLRLQEEQCDQPTCTSGSPRPATPDVAPESEPSPGGQSAEGADGHRVLGAVPAHVLEGLGQGAILVQAEVGHHEREGSRHPEIGDEANQEGGDDAHGDGLLGVLDLFA